jgi:hypothetical protein
MRNDEFLHELQVLRKKVVDPVDFGWSKDA